MPTQLREPISEHSTVRAEKYLQEAADFRSQTAPRVFNSVRSTPFYTEVTQSNDRGTAYMQAAEVASLDPEASYSDYERAYLKAVSTVGTFIESQQKLDHIQSVKKQNGWLPQHLQEQRQTLVESYAIPFNHDLKELINLNPNMTTDSLAFSLVGAYQSAYKNFKLLEHGKARSGTELISPNASMEYVLTAVQGMRNEIGAETILASLDIDYDFETTVKDDGEGADIFVVLNGVRYGIDIKGSAKGAESANEQSMRHGYAPQAIWSGLYPSDFRGSHDAVNNAVGISFETARKKSVDFKQRLEQLLGVTIR